MHIITLILIILIPIFIILSLVLSYDSFEACVGILASIMILGIMVFVSNAIHQENQTRNREIKNNYDIEVIHIGSEHDDFIFKKKNGEICHGYWLDHQGEYKIVNELTVCEEKK